MVLVFVFSPDDSNNATAFGDKALVKVVAQLRKVQLWSYWYAAARWQVADVKKAGHWKIGDDLQDPVLFLLVVKRKARSNLSRCPSQLLS